jgi:hypothetical protein
MIGNIIHCKIEEANGEYVVGKMIWILI